MLGHLVPSSGGTSILLQRERVYLGRRPDAAPKAPLNSETAICRLRLADGWWHVDGLLDPTTLRVNGALCTSRRLKPDDELAIGRARFRINYVAPEDPQAELEKLAEAVLFEDRRPAAAHFVETTAVALPDRAAPTAESTVPPPHPTVVAHATGLLGRMVPLGGGPDFPLLKPRVTIGRKPSCDVVLRFATVSSVHCGLEWLDGYWKAIDLGSRNGIRVDGVRCRKAWVFPKVRLTIADQRFQIDYAAQGERPEPDAEDPQYQKSLMSKLGLKDADLEVVLARQGLPEADEEPERKRWDLMEGM